jgi:DNA-binding response OmpR family regulator
MIARQVMRYPGLSQHAAFLPRPFTPDVLLTRVRGLLDRAANQQAGDEPCNPKGRLMRKKSVQAALSAACL